MLKNYLFVAFRSFWRNKFFSLINVTGLAIGLGSALAIYLIAHHELSFEKIHRDRNRIYRVVTEKQYPNQVSKMPTVPRPLPKSVQQEIPGIVISTEFEIVGRISVRIPDTHNPSVFPSQEDIVFADSSYFQMLDYEWLAGSKESALKGPNEVVLCESRARKYFDFPNVFCTGRA